MGKNSVVTKFKDTDRILSRLIQKFKQLLTWLIHIGSRYPIESRNRIDSRYQAKNDIDVSNDRKYVFPNVSYANILEQPSGIRRPSNITAYVSP